MARNVKKPQRRSKARAKPAARASSRKPSPIPKGYHAITPNLVVRDAARAIAFYQEVFGAKELRRTPSPDGKSVWHAEIRIGDSIVFLNDEFPQSSTRAPSPDRPATCAVMLYVRDSGAVFQKAVKAGATVAMPLADMFWGDRYGMVIDPFGVPWGISTRVRELSRAQLRKAAEAAGKAMSEQAVQPGDSQSDSQNAPNEPASPS